jgi:outer membrane lipoprotein-sorting protein
MSVLRAICLLVVIAPNLRGQAGTDPTRIARPSIDPLERAAATYGSVQSLTAKFEENRTVRATGLVIRRRGEIAWEAPNRYSVTYEGPRGDRQVFDGSVMWRYMRSASPPVVLHGPEGVRPWVIAWWRVLVMDARSKYTVSNVAPGFAPGVNTHLVNLVPDSTRILERARLWVEDTDGLVRRLEIDLPNKSLLEIRFSDIKVNPKISARAFSFTVPKGVEVYPPIECVKPGSKETASTTPRC